MYNVCVSGSGEEYEFQKPGARRQNGHSAPSESAMADVSNKEGGAASTAVVGSPSDTERKSCEVGGGRMALVEHEFIEVGGSGYGTNENSFSNQGMTNHNNKGEIGWKLVVDVVACLIVGIPILIFKVAVTPYRRGYFCDDDSIRLNYKDSTVTSLMLYLIGILFPVITFLTIEYFRFRKGQLTSTDRSFTLFGYDAHILLVTILRTLLFFAFACVCSQMLTDVAKYTIGRLRPHFLDVCQSTHPCGTSSDRDPHVYILDYHCTGGSSIVREARLSFPSGHASFSAVTMVYLALFIHFRVNWRMSPLLKPLFQFFCILLTFYTGLSRVSDNKHHWSDVLAGFLLGTTVALVVVSTHFFIYDEKVAKWPLAMVVSSLFSFMHNNVVLRIVRTRTGKWHKMLCCVRFVCAKWTPQEGFDRHTLNCTD